MVQQVHQLRMRQLEALPVKMTKRNTAEHVVQVQQPRALATGGLVVQVQEQVALAFLWVMQRLLLPTFKMDHPLRFLLIWEQRLALLQLQLAWRPRSCLRLAQTMTMTVAVQPQMRVAPPVRVQPRFLALLQALNLGHVHGLVHPRQWVQERLLQMLVAVLVLQRRLPLLLHLLHCPRLLLLASLPYLEQLQVSKGP
jgi:hypothetical protein